jgi:hypothetical protein
VSLRDRLKLQSLEYAVAHLKLAAADLLIGHDAAAPAAGLERGPILGYVKAGWTLAVEL